MKATSLFTILLVSIILLIHSVYCFRFEHVVSIDMLSNPWFIRYEPGNNIYLSIADDYVVFRIWISSSIDVRDVHVVINDTEIPMFKQFSIIDWIVWFGTYIYTGRPLMYFFKVFLRNGTIVNIFHTGATEFFFDGVNRFPQVEWVKYGVAYQIFPERFYNGDPDNDHYALESDMWSIVKKYEGRADHQPILSKWSDSITHLHCCHQYFGGDLKGVIEKLDYLYELGVRVIYFNPIFLSGSAHGYDPYDYYTVDPKFGTLEDLRKLLDEAHKRSIRVIFDYVPDHVGIGFWAFLDVYQKGRDSPYWSWFTIYRWPFRLLESGAYDCWWGFSSLPRLRADNPEVREYLIKVAIHWLDFGFDGFRVDTPLDVRESSVFFSELRSRVKTKYPNAYIVGEIWHYDPLWVSGFAFDSLMNYALGMGILLEYSQGKLVGTGRDHVSYRLAYYFANYGVNVAGMGFNNIATHDTSRLLTLVGGGGLSQTPGVEAVDRLKLVSTLLYMMPGSPVVFQGDERGIGGRRENYDEQRYPIQWDRLNKDIYEHFVRLGGLKTGLKPLHTSIIRVLDTSGSILAFTRGYSDEVLVVANNDRVSASYTLPPGDWELMYSTKNGVEITSGVIKLPPVSIAILVKRDITVSETTSPVTSPETSVSETTPITSEVLSLNETTPSISETNLLLPRLIVLTMLLSIFILVLLIVRRVFFKRRVSSSFPTY